jgi:nondiscriminating glutamyl-tRNA synthetase
LKKVRVRFAPSPTGYVHVGSLRTALYNFLFARHHHGDFILRIEDTDQARYSEGAVENLVATLKWSGLNYDEGPGHEGKYGPYFQSERTDLYRKYAEQLLAGGHAYPCFCSEERLEKMRREQVRQKITAKYDGFCRQIPLDEAAQRRRKEKHVIRLKVPAKGITSVADIIRGQVDFQNEMIDDQVLIKSDNFPTYHLANVVDDHLMEISHVIRGEEWLISTPKHLLLYQYFNWEPPEFAHLPLLLNADRSKLSKRQGDVAVEDYREKGYLSEALINYVALLGWNRGDDQEIFSVDELIKDFSLERVSKSGAVFSQEKLKWMNGIYIRKLPEEKYLELAVQALHKYNMDSGDKIKDDQIARAIRNGLDTFDDIREKARLFVSEGELVYNAEALRLLHDAGSKQVLQILRRELEHVSTVSLDNFRQIMGTVQKESGIKGKELWLPVRAALTGVTEGPELPQVIEILGKERIMLYLHQAINS